SQKRNEEAVDVDLEEIKAEPDGLNDAIGENEKELDGRVFGCADKVNFTCDEPTISECKNNCDMSNECLHDNHEIHGAKVNDFTNETVNDGEVINNKLSYIPIEIIGDDREVVIFDEELVADLGSQKWNMTLCGYFAWEYGITDILPHSDGIFLFKFSNEEGLQFGLENGPWLVINIPMLVQKRDPDVCPDRLEPGTLPIWVKLHNIPMEAWTDKGLSAIASRIGKPLIMDATTANVCKFGKEKVGYARILVEVDAKSEFMDIIELVYRSNNA
ncbi:RNA-directed DNA polymerase, eukaryota, reverse transcriptase zinc-binding domain protein, partial [Tanacetum coccineum]